MAKYPNITKALTSKGVYVGRSRSGDFYYIQKTTSSYGSWLARARENETPEKGPFYTFTLAQMSKLLEES